MKGRSRQPVRAIFLDADTCESLVSPRGRRSLCQPVSGTSPPPRVTLRGGCSGAGRRIQVSGRLPVAVLVLAAAAAEAGVVAPEPSTPGPSAASAGAGQAGGGPRARSTVQL